jgi:hypothetical protein
MIVWIDQHPYLAIYLLGCIFALLLIAFKLLLFPFIAWITKANIAATNLKKLDDPEAEVAKTFLQKAAVFVAVVIFESLLSWTNVLMAIWQIIKLLFTVVRDAFTQQPEAIKLLRFPLANNPDLTREAVWAYVHALKIRVGEQPADIHSVENSLNNIQTLHPHFNKRVALGHLKGLDVLPAERGATSVDSILDK